jgi:hypothetical protein
MKNLTLVLIVSIVLTGCELPEDEPCNAKYNYSNGKLGTTGLTLKATSETFITFGEMEAIYKDVQSCLKLPDTSGPVIEYASGKDDYWGILGGWGVFMVSDTIKIIMNTDQDLIPRNCHSDRETLRHEFVHHLLYMNGKYQDMESPHDSPAFANCKALGVKVCDGYPCAGI